MKLKRKIFLIFSLVAVIPMIFLTTYTVVQYTHMIDNRMEDISHEQQENLSDAIDASYTSIRQVFMLLTFASNTDSSTLRRPGNSYDEYGDLPCLSSTSQCESEYFLYLRFSERCLCLYAFRKSDFL